MKKIFFSLILLLMLPVIVYAKTYTVVLNAEYPPFEYVGGNSGKDILGLDVDLIHAIANYSKIGIKIEDISFDAIIPTLMSGKADIAISAMTITDSRAANVDFSEPYYKIKQAIIVRKSDSNNYSNIDELKGLKIGAQLGTSGDILARKLTNRSVSFNSNMETIMDVSNNKLDIALIDETTADSFVKKFPLLKVLHRDFFDEEYYGIAVKKGNADLLKSINNALKKIKADGTMNKLLEKNIR